MIRKLCYLKDIYPHGSSIGVDMPLPRILSITISVEDLVHAISVQTTFQNLESQGLDLPRFDPSRKFSPKSSADSFIMAMRISNSVDVPVSRFLLSDSRLIG